MPSKRMVSGSRGARATSAEREAVEGSVGSPARDEEIRRRAYEIYLERGEDPGREIEDWLQAEREIERRVL